MVIKTSTFGPMTIDEEKIISFREGIPGFENLRRFIIIILDQTRPFFWLQAIDEDISLPLISPFEIVDNYSPAVQPEVFTDLGLEHEEDLLVLSVAVIPREVTRMTANLAAPILINIKTNIGRQILIEGGEYQIRQPIFETVCRLMQEAGANAGTDTPE